MQDLFQNNFVLVSEHDNIVSSFMEERSLGKTQSYFLSGDDSRIALIRGHHQRFNTSASPVLQTLGQLSSHPQDEVR